MLYPRRSRNSPVKQNISPQSPFRSPRKQPNTLKSLIQLLKQHNIPVPQELIEKTIEQNSKNSCQLKLKEIYCNSQTQLKDLRIALGDTKFELKKLQEDFAQYKVMARMDKEKIVKKYITEIQILKRKIQEDNINWQKRYTENCQLLNQQKQLQQKAIIQQFQQRINQQISLVKQNYEDKLERLQQRAQELTKKMGQKQRIHELEKQDLINSYHQKINQQVDTLKVSSSEKHQEIRQKYEQKIQLIEFERKIDTKKFEDHLHSVLKQKESLQNDIYYLKKNIDELKQQLKSKQRKINQLQMAIRAKHQVLTSSIQEVEKEKQTISRQNQKNIDHLKEQHANQIRQLMSQHLTQIDFYYQRINKLQQYRLTIQNQYKEEFKILEHKFSQRLSKSEDIDEIQRLNTTIMVKDKEIARCHQEMKNLQLIKENNDKNYMKIFHSSRRKSANSHKDKQSFFKQNNPTDLKLLLKICQKDF